MEKHVIDDAGEFLPYARKHMVGETIATEPKPEAKTQPAITLQKLWPEPDWCQMHDVELDARAAL